MKKKLSTTKNAHFVSAKHKPARIFRLIVIVIWRPLKINALSKCRYLDSCLSSCARQRRCPTVMRQLSVTSVLSTVAYDEPQRRRTNGNSSESSAASCRMPENTTTTAASHQPPVAACLKTRQQQRVISRLLPHA